MGERLAVALALPGVGRLRIQDSWIDNFDPDSELVEAERIFNRDFWGSYRFDVVAEGPPGYFSRPSGAVNRISVSNTAQAKSPSKCVCTFEKPRVSPSSASGST